MHTNHKAEPGSFHSDILDGITEPLMVVDKSFKIDYINQAALADSQINALGEKCYNVFHEGETPCEPCPCMDAFEQEIALESLLIEEEVTSLGYAPSTSLFSATQEVMSKVERECILESLQECKGNKSKAARLLGISRASFYNKLKRYEIPVSL